MKKRISMKGIIIALFLFIPVLICANDPYDGYGDDSCTDIVVGKLASVDGSVITSHTGCGPDCRLRVVKGQTYEKGAEAPVYWGLLEVDKPIDEYGEIIGTIPQVEKTYTYIRSAYSHVNEHQLAIGESTMSQRDPLKTDRKRGKQIMTVEMAQIFALQRCKTSRDAVQVIASLIEKYGFLPSTGPGSEALCIADPNEAWIMEMFSVGPHWDPKSGELGAIWAAQRVPDDHVAMVPNWSTIKEIDLSKPDEFMTSKNYMQVAIDYGWYDPKGSMPFIWQKAYSPYPREWAVSRLWRFYSQVAPNLREWPKKELDAHYKNYDAYHQYLEDVTDYPFSVKPEKKMSVQDVIAFQRQIYEGTIYDMTQDFDWYVPDGKGGMKKSPLATPFPTKDMRELLDITYRRMVSRGGYGMVAQCRSWLPDPIGCVYWYYCDNQYISTYVPIYTGVQDIHPAYQEYDPNAFSETSARWGIDFVDNLLYLKWQEAIQDVKDVRDPLQEQFFKDLTEMDQKAKAVYEKDPEKARKILTEFTHQRMEESFQMFKKLRSTLITKYTNNKQRL